MQYPPPEGYLGAVAGPSTRGGISTGTRTHASTSVRPAQRLFLADPQ
jgi:hypothetical protein